MSKLKLIESLRQEVRRTQEHIEFLAAHNGQLNMDNARHTLSQAGEMVEYSATSNTFLSAPRVRQLLVEAVNTAETLSRARLESILREEGRRRGGIRRLLREELEAKIEACYAARRFSEGRGLVIAATKACRNDENVDRAISLLLDPKAAPQESFKGAPRGKVVSINRPTSRPRKQTGRFVGQAFTGKLANLDGPTMLKGLPKEIADAGRDQRRRSGLEPTSNRGVAVTGTGKISASSEKTRKKSATK